MISEGDKSPGKKDKKKIREGTDGSPGIANWLQGRANHLRGREELAAASNQQKTAAMHQPCCGAYGLCALSRKKWGSLRRRLRVS